MDRRGHPPCQPLVRQQPSVTVLLPKHPPLLPASAAAVLLRILAQAAESQVGARAGIEAMAWIAVGQRDRTTADPLKRRARC
jgi:hypothetical protein